MLSERKHFFIGNEGMFSFSVWSRNADSYLIQIFESIGDVSFKNCFVHQNNSIEAV